MQYDAKVKMMMLKYSKNDDAKVKICVGLKAVA